MTRRSGVYQPAVRHALLLATTVLLSASTPRAPVTVHLIGDSTMADRADPEKNPERGWGQALPAFAAPGVVVRNHAVNGRSTKSFIDEGRWEAVRKELRNGDYVFIQFGHNDEKSEDSARYTAPFTAYRRNLDRFVRETRAAKARPVLFTSIVRRKFNAQGVLEDTHGLYPLAVRDVARALDVPLVDLQLLTEELVLKRGVEESRKIYVYTKQGEFPAFPEAQNDDTHLSHAGAREVALLAVEALVQLNKDIARLFSLPGQEGASGEQRGRTGSQLTEADLRGQAVSRVEELFVGRFTGVQVFSTGTAISVRIRGSSTVNGSGEPLYVIDGQPIEAGPGGLITLNPRDIVNIEVLKDIASLAEYGVRGANGVIRITTRRQH